MNYKKNRCRICNYSLNEFPWGEDGNDPSFKICPCCGVEFGYEDATDKAIIAYREQWIKNGCKWFDESEKPENWDYEKQLSED